MILEFETFPINYSLHKIYNQMLIIRVTITNVFICCTVDALQEITSTMGATYWKFNGDLCQIEIVGTTPTKPEGSESSVDCECNFENSTTCRVIRMYNILILLVYAISFFISYTSTLLIITSPLL